MAGRVSHLEGQGAVLQLAHIERQRVGGDLLTRRPVSAPGRGVLKHLPLTPIAPKLCARHTISNITSSSIAEAAQDAIASSHHSVEHNASSLYYGVYQYS